MTGSAAPAAATLGSATALGALVGAEPLVPVCGALGGAVGGWVGDKLGGLASSLFN